MQTQCHWIQIKSHPSSISLTPPDPFRPVRIDLHQITLITNFKTLSNSTKIQLHLISIIISQFLTHLSVNITRNTIQTSIIINTEITTLLVIQQCLLLMKFINNPTHTHIQTLSTPCLHHLFHLITLVDPAHCPTPLILSMIFRKRSIP